jgi:hypothetical protein
LTIKTEIAAFGFHMETYHCCVTFQFLTAVNINLTASWAVGPCNIFEIGDVSAVLTASIIREMMGVACTSKTLI